MANTHILGVDIGTSAIKVLAATTEEDGRIRVQGSGTVACDGFARGTVTDAAALAAAIREAVDCAVLAAGIPSVPVHLGIGAVDLAAKNSIGSIVPAAGTVGRGDIAQACRAATGAAAHDGQRVLHALPIGFWLDGRPEIAAPVGRKCGRLEVETHIVSMPGPPLDELIAALAIQKIDVAAVFANAVVGTSAVADRDSCLVMDIGAGLTDLALFNGRKIVFSASIPLGGDYITNDIMQGLDVSKIHAEEIERYYAKLNRSLSGQDVVLDCNDYGTTDKQVDYDFLNKIVESRAEEIVSLLHAYVEPALSRYGAEEILLTGGLSLLPSVGEWTGKAFDLPVRMVRPADSLPAEYRHPTNTACFGLVEYVARLAAGKRDSGGPLSRFLKKIRQFT